MKIGIVIYSMIFVLFLLCFFVKPYTYKIVYWVNTNNPQYNIQKFEYCGDINPYDSKIVGETFQYCIKNGKLQYYTKDCQTYDGVIVKIERFKSYKIFNELYYFKL